MRTRRQAHVIFRSMYHVVWIPRYRYKVLNKGVAEYLKAKMVEVRKYYPEIEYEEINIQEDHVHVLLDVPPSFGVPKAVQLIKQNTGVALKKKFEFIRKT